MKFDKVDSEMSSEIRCGNDSYFFREKDSHRLTRNKHLINTWIKFINNDDRELLRNDGLILKQRARRFSSIVCYQMKERVLEIIKPIQAVGGDDVSMNGLVSPLAIPIAEPNSSLILFL